MARQPYLPSIPGNGNPVQKGFDQPVQTARSLEVGCRYQTMPQHRRSHVLHIVRQHKFTAMDQSPCLAHTKQGNGGTRAGAQVNFGVVTRSFNQIQDVLSHQIAHQRGAHLLLKLPKLANRCYRGERI